MRVTLIQGGGSGADQVPAVKSILSAAGVSIDWDEHAAGRQSMQTGGDPIPEALLDSVRRNKVALKTKLLPPPGEQGKGRRNYNVDLRRRLGLFATVRPLKNLPGLPARFTGVDMVVIREITEDLYAAIEHEIVAGVVQSIKVVTKAASERFLRFAYEYARQNGRKSIACVHKANILKLADGLFLRAFEEVGKDYPEFDPAGKPPTRRGIIVDNCCMQLVANPHQFDVLVMGNLYGDLVSDLAAGLVGGVSATHGINVGGVSDELRVYESFHGGGREVFPEETANPLPLLLPAMDLISDHGHGEAARRILAAVGEVLTARETLTRDLGGTAGTAEMAGAIVKALG